LLDTPKTRPFRRKRACFVFRSAKRFVSPQRASAPVAEGETHRVGLLAQRSRGALHGPGDRRDWRLLARMSSQFLLMRLGPRHALTASLFGVLGPLGHRRSPLIRYDPWSLSQFEIITIPLVYHNPHGLRARQQHGCRAVRSVKSSPDRQREACDTAVEAPAPF